MVDCAVFTEHAVIFIEGKRTEWGPAKEVSWYPERNQIIRNLDCAAQCARERGVPHYFVLLVVEGSLMAEASRKDALDRVTTPATIKASLPHLSETERSLLLDHYLGHTTWERIVAQFGLPPDTLIEAIG